MKRQILIGLVAGSLFAFAGMALAQGTPAQTGASAPAATAPAKKETAKHTANHKKWKHSKTSKHKAKTKAPAAHTGK
ncbi:MAG: hypothetical protein WBR15_07525 [Gammaproteobacteria bacterium]